MGRLDNQPNNLEPDDPRVTKELLRSMTNDLRNLQQDLISQLNQDVQRLQAEKSRLLNDIDQLQNQRQSLQSDHQLDLSQQQLAQQQAWAKQFALALANHLHVALTQRLSQTLNTHQIQRTVDVPQISVSQPETENTYRLLASIDETINRAFSSLRHDLSSYQSSLSQQIGRMHDLGQQGEVILEVLVNRISQQLQSDMLRNRVSDRPISESSSAPQSFNLNPNLSPNPSSNPSSNIPPNLTTAPPPPSPTTGYPPDYSSTYPPEPTEPPPPLSSTFTYSRSDTAASPVAAPSSPSSPPPVVPPPEPVSPSAGRATPSRRSSPFRSGVILMVFSTATLALHHVIVQILGTEGRLFGNPALPLGGYTSLETFSTSILVLWVRMIAIVPLMAWLAGLLYQPVWRDVKSFFVSRDRRLLWSLVGSGIFLLLSQVFLYIAIGEIGPAVAVTVSAIYPLVTVPTLWLLFSDRPSRLRILALFAIAVGVAFTLFTAHSNLSEQGIVAGFLSGITFALYLVAMMIVNRRKLNPVPISVIQNATMFVLSSIFLIGVGAKVAPTNWVGLLVGGLLLGALTIVSYFLSDVGSRLLGPARATLITASVPALTALLAFLVFPSAANSLGFGQIIGVLVVTLGIAGLSFERVLFQYKTSAKQAK